MKLNRITQWIALALLASEPTAPAADRQPIASPAGRTKVSIVGEDFHLNGQPTYAGRSWKGHRIEGLLLNSRMVQATFDDLNPETARRWAYADTGTWDAGVLSP